ncbi:MAG: AI-2E family transporter [Kiritimatiellae bacterium]|nr:AI-2E family transporter [Kiritimatiellia bacterium]
MVNFTPSQNRMVATGATVLAFTFVLAFALFIGWALLRFVSFASPALTPVVAGLFLALLFKPYYGWFLVRVRNPTLAFVLTLASVLVPLGLACWFGGAMVVEQISHLLKSAPTIVTRASDWVNQHYPNAQALLSQFGAAPDDLQLMFLTDPARFSRDVLSELGSTWGASAMKAGVGFLKYVMGLVSWLVALVFFAFFLTRPAMKGSDYVKHMPFLKDGTKGFVARQIDSFIDILVNFFQRQVVICLIEGVLYGTGFMLVGLPYGFVIGFLLGVLNLVPLLGTVLCLPLALPIAYFGDGGSLLRLIGVLSVWLTGQVLDGYLITPKIQGEKTGLGYAGVIFSFFFWGTVFHSMLGLLLAIPLSAFCVVLWRALKDRYIKGVI